MAGPDQNTDNKKDENKRLGLYAVENDNNLGLDADHSSEDHIYKVNLNNDNDRISHNRDGEDDDTDTTEEPGYSPLEDK
jgi:hypothetical protein